MELKIRIKEEMRELTIEEWAMYLLSKNVRSIYQHDAQDIVKSWGLIEFENGLIGFRTETIRDATQEEIIAWYCIQSHIVCLTTDAETCRACPKNRGSNQCKMLEDYFESKKILKDKEIILELV